VSFEGPEIGWVVLRTGRDAGAWGAPGVAAQLLDRVPAERLRPLGVVPPARPPGAGASWGGGPAELAVAEDSPQLAEIAEALAPLLGGPAHPVRARRVPRAELEARRSDFALLLEFVRSVGPPGRATLLGLLASVDPELAARPPEATSYAPAEIARRYSFGVVGALRVAGARLAPYRGLETWQLGAVFRAPSEPTR
jgi:peptide/nickel transport system substrate-binding protein